MRPIPINRNSHQLIRLNNALRRLLQKTSPIPRKMMKNGIRINRRTRPTIHRIRKVNDPAPEVPTVYSIGTSTSHVESSTYHYIAYSHPVSAGAHHYPVDTGCIRRSYGSKTVINDVYRALQVHRSQINLTQITDETTPTHGTTAYTTAWQSTTINT